MDDVNYTHWHASRIRALASELEQTLPSGQWRGPSELECRLRILEARDQLYGVSRLLDSATRDTRP